MRYYTNPLYVGLNRIVVKLEGDRLFMEKEPVSMTVTLKSSINLDGFTELDPESFSKLAEAQASQESKLLFKQDWEAEFGPRKA